MKSELGAGIIGCLLLLMVTLGQASAQEQIEWGMAGEHQYDGITINIDTIVSGMNKYAVIYVNGSSARYEIGDIIAEMFEITDITETEVIVNRLESEQPSIPEGELVENIYELKSGEVLLLTEGATVMGALAYSPQEAMQPTFAFWSAGRTPSAISVPLANEKATLSIGDSFSPQTIQGLTLRLLSADSFSAEVELRTPSYDVSRVISPFGQQDYTDLIEKAVKDALMEHLPPKENVVYQYPPSEPAASPVLVNIAIGIFIALAIGYGGSKAAWWFIR